MDYETLIKNIDKDLVLLKTIPPPAGCSDIWAQEIHSLNREPELLNLLKNTEYLLERVKVMDKAMNGDWEIGYPYRSIAQLESARGYLKKE